MPKYMRVVYIIIIIMTRTKQPPRTRTQKSETSILCTGGVPGATTTHVYMCRVGDKVYNRMMGNNDDEDDEDDDDDEDVEGDTSGSDYFD